MDQGLPNGTILLLIFTIFWQWISDNNVNIYTSMSVKHWTRHSPCSGEKVLLLDTGRLLLAEFGKSSPTTAESNAEMYG